MGVGVNTCVGATVAVGFGVAAGVGFDVGVIVGVGIGVISAAVTIGADSRLIWEIPVESVVSEISGLDLSLLFSSVFAFKYCWQPLIVNSIEKTRINPNKNSRKPEGGTHVLFVSFSTALTPPIFFCID